MIKVNLRTQQAYEYYYFIVAKYIDLIRPSSGQHRIECWPEGGLIRPKTFATIITNIYTLSLCFHGNFKTFCFTFELNVGLLLTLIVGLFA